MSDRDKPAFHDAARFVEHRALVIPLAVVLVSTCSSTRSSCIRCPGASARWQSGRRPRRQSWRPRVWSMPRAAGTVDRQGARAEELETFYSACAARQSRQLPVGSRIRGSIELAREADLRTQRRTAEPVVDRDRGSDAARDLHVSWQGQLRTASGGSSTNSNRRRSSSSSRR